MSASNPRGNPCVNAACIAKNGANHRHLSMADRVPNGNPVNDAIARMQAEQRAERENAAVVNAVRCAYAASIVETRALCTCPTCQASRYHRPMRDAIAEANGTRASRSEPESGTMAAAELARDVALAAARDTEERTVALAATVRAQAEANATATYNAACKRIADAELAMRKTIARYASMNDDVLVEALRMETFRLSRTVGRMRADEEIKLAVNVRAMREVLESRGVDIPRWRFQDRTATS